MSYADTTYKHAYSEYQKAVDAEGAERQKLLKNAESILSGVPDDYPEKSELMDKIQSMIY